MKKNDPYRYFWKAGYIIQIDAHGTERTSE